MKNTANLLSSKKFLPLFITQFFGAFNDNIFKNALVIFITYSLVKDNPQIMVTMVAFLFILPFFLFSSLAGQIADKYDKSKISRIIKLVEIILMIMASYGFYTKNLVILMIVLFSMGVHSTFFGPVKYGIIPQILKKDEIVAGNGLISSATFISILLGTIIGGILILKESGIIVISSLVIIISIIGFISSIFIPKTPSNDLKIGFNIFLESYKIIKEAKVNKRIFLSIIGVSWFWFVGATFLSQFPNYVKIILNGNNEIVTLMLTIFSVGIAIGSLLCNKILRGRVSAIYAPVSLLIITIFITDLYFASPLVRNIALQDFSQFINNPKNFRILFDLLMISIASGLYVVPLYSIVQIESKEENRARTIAALNIIDSGAMVLSAIFTIILYKLNFSVIEIFLGLAFINLLVAIYICKLLPEALLKSILQAILKLFFKVEVKALENYQISGNTIIIANHTSFLDAVLIASFLPDKFSFAVNSEIAKRWYFKPFFKLVEIFPVDPTNPMSVKSMINLVKSGKKLVIFPEGRITMTGTLMKVYSGPAVIAKKTDALILPIRVDGAQYSIFSRLKGRVRTRLFPKITLTIMPPCKLTIDRELSPRAERVYLAEKLYELMVNLVFETSNYKQTLFSSLIDAAKINGYNHKIIEDFTFNSLNFRQLLTKSFGLGLYLKKYTKSREMTGLLLPNSNVTAIVFFALQAFSRVPVMLNFTAGLNNLLSSAKTSRLKIIITSKRFIEKSNSQNLVDALDSQGHKIIYLEEIKVSFLLKLTAFIAGYIPESFYKIFNKKYKDHNLAEEKYLSGKKNIFEEDLPAVVLFTSGSEGSPKGVVLSHKNIQSNRCQLSSKIDFGPKDIVFNALPMFHSFGLTGATLLPILSGVKTFFYPSPLHYKIVPELSYSTNATILFGTNSFLAGYAKFAHNYDFYSIRYVFAGAEKLSEDTRKAWIDKFGLRILEGYGATETSPIISVNTPMQNKIGSVGKLLPSITARLEKIEEVGNKLIVTGPNIMLGYLLLDKPGELKPSLNNEYDTGDIVDIDEDGYIFIKGRAKRFAKIAGEMVSLTLVENYMAKLWPKNISAVITKPDEKKGEQLILVIDKKDIEKAEISKFFKENGLSEISIPKSIFFIEKIPLLGTGKIDYVKINELIKT